MLEITVAGNTIQIGNHCTIRLERTLRLPDDGKTYPLPPSLGHFPIARIADYADRVPEDWRKLDGIFIPMYQSEALWLNFLGHDWHPVAMKVGVGRINALTGATWDHKLRAHPQDYLVCPTQPWLDGINTGDGTIRQFVAMPLGLGYTVEGQVTGEEHFGGIQLVVFDAKGGRFPEEDPTPPKLARRALADGMGGISAMAAPTTASMGIAAGGKMKQSIYPDPHGVNTWDDKNRGEIAIHIVNSEQYQAITGIAAPTTPVDASAYTAHGYPWYALYDEAKGDIAPSEGLQKVRSVNDLDREKGLPPRKEESSFEVLEEQIRQIGRDRKKHLPDKP